MASADMQWPFYSGELVAAHGPFVLVVVVFILKLLFVTEV